MSVRHILGVAVIILLLPLAVPAQELKEDVLWATIEKSTNPDDFQGYLDAYPNGIYAPLARRRLGTILEAKRSNLAGSEWEGKEWYTTTFTGRMRSATPEDPKAKFTTVEISFAENGQCIVYGKQPCTWNKTGDTVTITAPNIKGMPCFEEFSLKMENRGTAMSGTVNLRESRSCLGNHAFVTASRSGAAAKAAASAAANAQPIASAAALANGLARMLEDRRAATAANLAAAETAYRNNQFAEAFPLFKEAADSGNARAMTFLGFMYSNGQGVARNDLTARQLYERAAAAGDSTAMRNLGTFYRTGAGGVTQDHQQARQWYEKSAAAGLPAAMTSLGLMHWNGEGTPASGDVALQWFRKAAAQGDATAMDFMGFFFAGGIGVTRDLQVARQWYEKAAAGGNQHAKQWLQDHP